jgi:formylglycine-generating enzyme required for sulfatase activity
MHGNVWEWVRDCWHPTFEGAPDDGTPRTETTKGTTCDGRVVRGGSYRSHEPALRSDSRNAFPPGHSRPTVGFRVVREIK